MDTNKNNVKTTNIGQQTKARRAAQGKKILGAVCLFVGTWVAATSGLFVRTTDVGGAAVAFYRAALSMPVFAILYLFVLKKAPPSPRPVLKLLFFTGIGGAIIGPLYHMAYRYTTIANAELIINMTPLVVIPLSWFLYREKITWNFFFALMLAIAGLVVLLSAKIEANFDNFLGDLMAGATCLAYGAYILLIAAIRRHLAGPDAMFYLQLVFAIMLVPVILLTGEQWLPGSWSSFFSLVALSLFTNLVGMGCIVMGLGMINASLGAVIIMTQPIAGAIYGTVFWGETLSNLELLGITICIAGVIYANITSIQAKQRKVKIDK